MVAPKLMPRSYQNVQPSARSLHLNDRNELLADGRIRRVLASEAGCRAVDSEKVF